MEIHDLVQTVSTRNVGTLDQLTKARQSDLFAALAQEVGRAVSGSSDILSMRVIDLDKLPMDDETVSFGKRIFRRWNKAAHDFLCSPDPQNDELRERVLRAITGRDAGAPALLAASLVATFGIAPAVAAIVSALLMQIVIGPFADELCWKWTALLASS